VYGLRLTKESILLRKKFIPNTITIYNKFGFFLFLFRCLFSLFSFFRLSPIIYYILSFFYFHICSASFPNFLFLFFLLLTINIYNKFGFFLFLFRRLTFSHFLNYLPSLTLSDPFSFSYSFHFFS
jgi:hypothetical protein